MSSSKIQERSDHEENINPEEGAKKVKDVAKIIRETSSTARETVRKFHESEAISDSIPVSIDVWDCHIRLFANANGKMFDLCEAATERDKKRAEKMVDQKGMINTSGQYGDMIIRVGELQLAKFMNEAVLDELKKLQEDSKLIKEDASTFKGRL